MQLLYSKSIDCVQPRDQLCSSVAGLDTEGNCYSRSEVGDASEALNEPATGRGVEDAAVVIEDATACGIGSGPDSVAGRESQGQYREQLKLKLDWGLGD